MRKDDPLNTKICLAAVEERVSDVKNERKLQTYAKLSEELFIDPNNVHFKKSTDSIRRL